MTDDFLYIENIADCIKRIEKFTQTGESEFLGSDLVQAAVIRQFEIIGEATKRLSKEYCESHPEIPWREMAKMRDKLIHDYLGVNLNRVWQTISQDLPILKMAIEKIRDPQL